MNCYTTEEWEELAKAAADKVGLKQTNRLKGVLRALSGKGWDPASIVVGFALGRELSFDESLALANETRYPMLDLPKKPRKTRSE